MYEHPNALLTRVDGGVQVSAVFMPIMQLAGIDVRNGVEERFVRVDPAQLKDAFDHPALYLDSRSSAKFWSVR